MIQLFTQSDIIDFCNNYDYDIRKSGNGRWIDQKCTADVTNIIADCIMNFVGEGLDTTFTSLEIWHSDYAIENIEAIFKKPGLESKYAKNEYDKFFQQPMEMLAYSGVLIKYKKGNRNYYQVNDYNVLEYIALREKNTLFFIKTYIEKVLTDSGIMYLFEAFFEKQTKENYEHLKKGFSNFTIKYTKINGETECNRIFIKILNPLAYFRDAYGTERGRISRQIITYDMLMYNRNNFRDIYADKPKDVTRKEFKKNSPPQINDAYFKYLSIKAKKFIRKFNDTYRNGKSEHYEPRHLLDKATNIHHIFAESEYPEISAHLENLIALTPTQHFNYAHPDGRTQEVNESYQHLLLISKVDRINENFKDNSVETIYDFSKLLYVLYVGFDDVKVLNIPDMNFSAVINTINIFYSIKSDCYEQLDDIAAETQNKKY